MCNNYTTKIIIIIFKFKINYYVINKLNIYSYDNLKNKLKTLILNKNLFNFKLF